MVNSSRRFKNALSIALALVAALWITSFAPPGQSITIGAIQPEAIDELTTGEVTFFWVDVTLTDPSVSPSFEWEVDSGQILGETNGEQILYEAPLEAGSVELKVTVGDDGHQVSTSKTISIIPHVLPEPEPDQIYTVDCPVDM
jgi:hypothetical protein